MSNKMKLKKVQKVQSGTKQPTVDVGKLISEIHKKVSLTVKAFIFPLKHLMDSRYRDYENLLANVIALQTILMRKGIVDKDEFIKEYNDVIDNSIGRVNKEGQMRGFCGIEIYNMEKVGEKQIEEA